MNDMTPTREQREAALEGLGCKRKRVEDARFTQGKGNYVDDLKLPAAHNVNSLLYRHHPEIFEPIRRRGDSRGRANRRSSAPRDGPAPRDRPVEQHELPRRAVAQNSRCSDTGHRRADSRSFLCRTSRCPHGA